MILNVTEEQKQILEERGHTVIEFKKWCYDFIKRFNRAITDVWNALIFFIQDVSERIIIPCIEKIKERMHTLADTYKDFFKPECFYFEPKGNFPYIRSLGIKYNPNISNRVIYYRCRDRC